MKNILLITVIGLTILITGCKTTTITPISIPTTKKIERGAKVYITTPRDGNYGSELYKGSGDNVATALEAAFIPYTDNIIVGGEFDSTPDAVEAAKLKNCQYLVLPRITHWEDRATEWSGIPDRIEVFIQVVYVENGTEITSVKINGKSSWFTLGGDHPQDLLKDPVQKFVGSLF